MDAEKPSPSASAEIPPVNPLPAVIVAVWSPSPGQVNIAPLMKNGELPSSEMRSLVEEAVNDENVRPLTDQVNVQSPSQVNYNVSATYYILKEYSGMVSEILSSYAELFSFYKSHSFTQ